MSIRQILKMGDPRLLRQAGTIDEFDTPDLHALIADMFDTMRAADGVGLAAPQIGVNLQLVIFGFNRSERYPNASPVPETILLNPVLTPLSAETEDNWEGCLSVPGLRGMVTRWRELRYTGFDQFGRAIDRSVDGFHARVAQHECDHLAGILYPMRITDFSRFGYIDALSLALDAAGD